MHSRRHFLKIMGSSLTALYGAQALCSAEVPGKKKPNIILCFIDDMGWGDLSCFGNKEVITGNIDRLAQEGIRFRQFYVNSPICSPSRVAISTGQYPHRWRITSYLNNRKSNNQRGIAQWLDPGAPMLARFLKESGYATGHFGKWHMGGQRDVDDAPLINEYGFDESLTNFEGMGPKLLPMTMKPGWDKAGRIWADAERLGGPAVWMQRSKITSGFVNSAMGFIKRAKMAGRPFYVNLWPDDVHSPFFPPVETWGDGQKRTLYKSVLDAMDKQLGTLFDLIRDDEDLRNNTLIIFCSDNGPESGAGVAGNLRGCKTMLYEGGIRSPLIVWGPGLINPDKVGSVNGSSFMAAIDLAPTLLKIAGVEVPKNTNFDGQELADVLTGHSQDSRTKPLFFRRPPDRDSFYGVKNLPDLAVRQGNWKLLCEYDGSNPELYDLIEDPSEKNNLASQKTDLVKQMTKLVTDWHKSIPQDNGATFGK